MNARALLKVGLMVAVIAMSGAQFAHAEEVSSTSSTATTTNTLATTTSASAAPTAASSTAPAASSHKENQTEIKALLESKFADAPAMIAIAKCESNFRQFTDAGNPLRGPGGMIGVFQFAESVHKSAALARGYDINTTEGNVGYARYIYGKQGTDPWISSFSCWNKASQSASPVSSTHGDSSSLNKDLSFGMEDAQVITLQKLLNSSGFSVADSGPGSSGNETAMFGNLTRAAVRKFQCAEMNICSGDEYSTGYGYVESKTRAALYSQSGSGSSSPSNSRTAPKPSQQSSENADSSASQSANANLASAPSTASSADLESVQAQIAMLMKIIELLQAQIALLSR